MKLLLTSICIFLAFYTFSQSTVFHKIYLIPNDLSEGGKVLETSDGGYLFCGQGFNQALRLIRSDSNADSLWTLELGSWYNKVANVIELPNGNFVVGGDVDGFSVGWSYYYLAMVSPTGTLLWDKTYGAGTSQRGETALDMRSTTDGGFILVGWTTEYGPWGDMYVVKVDSIGDTLWTRTYGTAERDIIESIVEVSGGCYISAGFTDSFIGLWGHLMKLDANGDTLWTATLRGPVSTLVSDIDITSDGNLIIAGSVIESSGDNAAMMLVKMTQFRTVLWAKSYGGTSNYDWGLDVVETPDGGFALLGETESLGFGQQDIILIKTDGSGNLTWAKTYGDTLRDEPNGLNLTSDGGFLIGGRTRVSPIDLDMLFIKTDQWGYSGCRQMDVPAFENNISLTVETGALPELQLNITVADPPPNGFNNPIRDSTLCTGISGTVSIANTERTLFLHPNPTTGVFTVSGATGPVQVFDLPGRLVYQHPASSIQHQVSGIQIDLSAYPSGVYFVRVGQATRKLILQ